MRRISVYTFLLFVLLLTLTSCGEKKYKENIVTAKSCFSDTTISLTCKCELIPSTENVVFFLSNSTLSEMKEMIEDATIYDDTLDSQVTFIKDGCYFVLKEKFSDKIKNKYVLSSDYAQIVVETGVKHYTIPFPQYICPVYYVESDIIPLEYKNVLTKYYNNLKLN